MEKIEESSDNGGGGGWITTFADLMSLLMCFFVLLLSFSEMDVLKFKRLAGSLSSAFGVQQRIRADDPPKGTSIIAQEFSPGTPRPTPLNEIWQKTANESRNSLGVACQDQGSSNTGESGDAQQMVIVDATRWAIDRGIADPERLCVFGWSFGGYSAAMTIVREPDLFKCSVTGAGVYDNKIQFDSDFGENTRWGRKFLDEVVGDCEALDSASPKYYVDKIKTALLLIRGDADTCVPIEHAYEMQKAYRRAGKPEPRLIKLKNEAHTPRKEENKYEYQKATIDFIEQHIGPGLLPK